MAIKNTQQRYGTIAKYLHWGTALLFLASYVSVYYRHWFTTAKTPENWTALQLHLSFGITIGILVTLRIIWRLMNVNPDPVAGTKIQQLMAHLGHYALYGLLIILVLTGYLGTGVNTEFFLLFDITKFENTWIFSTLIQDGLGLSFAELEKPLDFIHKDILGAWFAWILVFGHVAAALYHHFIYKDETLIRMTNGKQR